MSVRPSRWPRLQLLVDQVPAARSSAIAGNRTIGMLPDSDMLQSLCVARPIRFALVIARRFALWDQGGACPTLASSADVATDTRANRKRNHAPCHSPCFRPCRTVHPSSFGGPVSERILGDSRPIALEHCTDAQKLTRAETKRADTV